MNLIDQGRGAPVLLIPGIQGRWEWMKPTVQALAAQCRVLTFSLADEPSAGADLGATGFDGYVAQVRQALDQARLERAVICGMSYGGLIAAALAARHPERVSGLVLASALPPSWQLNDRARFYLRAPRLLAPFFCLASVRLYPEIAAASSGGWAGARVAARMGARAIRYPFHPT
ncbi:MAG TPA: alpha/beta hydrolase, partial [Vicinamibacterales bacterium]|nr:alpha/beta hydrolase [Vicinamibacterales bacterium]